VSNVVDFKKGPGPDEMIWICECGCQSFWLRADFKAECLTCGAIPSDENGEWRTQLPTPPETAEPVDGDLVKSVVIDSDVLALRQTLAMADVEKTCFVAVVQKNGHVRTFGDTIGHQEGIEWVDERLADVRRMIVQPDED
jgi:hypothetical protein